MAIGSLKQITDGLINAVTGQGTRRDPRTAASYQAPVPMTLHDIDAAYRASGLMRKIIQIPALDMVREWRDWKLEQKHITAVEDEEKRLLLRQKVRQVEVLRRMGGGALIMGLPGNPANPAPEGIEQGGLAYVNVVSRWNLTFSELLDDARLADYGEPVMWKLHTGSGAVDVHPSRVVPFKADTTASLASQTFVGHDAYWGESVVQQVLDAVKDSDTARASFASLMHKARLNRIGIPNLMDLVSTTAGTQMIQSRIETMVLAESLHNATIFDAGGEDGKGGEQITDATYNFQGAKDLINAYAEFASAISDIPATRLLGRSPEGMNASGDSQQKDWQKKIRAMQTLDLGPCLDRLDPFLIASAIGSVPDGQWYEFAPLDTPGAKECAEIFKIEMEAAVAALNTGAIPDEAFARGFQSLLIDRGYLPGLEAALLEIPEAERFGITPEITPEKIAALAQQQAGGQQPTEQ